MAEALIYVPNYNNGNCAYIHSNGVIRVYDTTPTNNSTIQYKDYYINSGYINNNGSTTFSQYSSLPVCINPNRITTEVYYRNDFPQILLTFVLLSFICFWVPWCIFRRMFRRYI